MYYPDSNALQYSRVQSTLDLVIGKLCTLIERFYVLENKNSVVSKFLSTTLESAGYMSFTRFFGNVL